MNTIRIFIAIDLPPEVKEKIAKTEWELVKHNLPYRFEDEQKLHITLAFLGNIQTQKIPGIEEILENTAGKMMPFVLQISSLDAFPGFKHPRILHLSVNGELTKLETLQKNVLVSLKEIGFKPRSNDVFRPHITLARLTKTPYPIHLKNTGNQILGLKIKVPQLSFSVNSISLMQSTLSSKGSTYKAHSVFHFSDSFVGQDS